MSKIKKEDYLCLSAMLRAREAKMLDRAAAERLSDASGFEDAAKQLTEYGYEDLSLRSAKEVGEALLRRRDEILAGLAQLAPDRTIVDAFRMKYDYHNAKTVLKAEAAGTAADGVLSGSGRIDPERLADDYAEQRYGDLPDTLAAALAEAKETLARTGNPQAADFLLDRAYFAELSRAAKESGSGFFTGYVRLLIDRANLGAVVRTARMGKTEEFLREALVPGGSVEEERILNAPEEARTALFAAPPLTAAAAAGESATHGGSMTAFELACDNAVTAYLGKAKMAAYGEEVLIAYLAAAESELTAVRMILTGLRSGIAPSVIRERLRDLYA